MRCRILFVTRHRPDDGVGVIGHDHPCAKFVTLAVEMFQRTRDKVGNPWFAQPAGAVSGIEQGFHLIAIPREKLLLLVPGERAFGGAGLFEDNLAFVLEPGDFVGGQRISETKRDEINRALLFDVWKFPAKMQPGYQRIWRGGICGLFVLGRHER